MSFPKYPAYKDSGVEWLGEVPSHWSVTPLKWLAEQITDKANASGFQVGLENIQGWAGRLIETDTEFSGDGIAFRSGDILFGKLRPYLAKVWFSDRAGQAVGDFFVLRPSSVKGEFLHKYILTPTVINNLNASTIGAKMPRVGWEDMAALAVTLPSLHEQTQIAYFLDHETARIDALIEEQQRLIELLKEKRQAVISHAVTKGLDPTVPMKDSGVEWLGEVPAHWILIPIKYLALLNPKKADFAGDTEQLCSFVPMEKLKTGVVQLDEERLIEEVIGGYTYFENGDVLQAKVTPCFENKNVAIAQGLTNGIGFGSSEINVLRPYQGVSAEYLYYRVQEDSYMSLCTSSMIGAGGLKRVPTDVINDFKIAAPKLCEQTQIARFLDHETARIDALIEEANSGVCLLQERRSALISAAVTGKIDVRNWQPPAGQYPAGDTRNRTEPEVV